MSEKNKQKKVITPVSKPFLRGDALDSATGKAALSFLAIWLIAVFMCLIVCLVALPDNATLRIVINLVIEGLVLMIFYASGASRGTDAVSRSEIMYQRQEAGHEVSGKDRSLCFHTLKGFVNGLIGTLPLLIPAVVLALTAQKIMTSAGTLPSWISNYQNRSEVGDALISYTVQAPMTLTDICRTAVRVLLMPLVSMVGAENKDALLLLERLSPLAMLLPAIAYGLGYTRGPMQRTRVHTEIAQNIRKRKKKERRERKARMTKDPQQLN